MQVDLLFTASSKTDLKQGTLTVDVTWTEHAECASCKQFIARAQKSIYK